MSVQVLLTAELVRSLAQNPLPPELVSDFETFQREVKRIVEETRTLDPAMRSAVLALLYAELTSTVASFRVIAESLGPSAA